MKLVSPASFSLASLRLLVCVGTLLIAPVFGQTGQTHTPPVTTPNAAAPPVPPDVTKALQLPKGFAQNTALKTAAGEWAKKNPMEALDWVLNSPLEIGEKAAEPVCAACGAAYGRPAAEHLLQHQQIPPGIWRTRYMHPLLVSWAKASPSTAIEWALHSPTDIRYLAVFSVADGYCRIDPAGASSWALTLNSPDERLAAIEAVALERAHQDLATATQWIVKLKPNELNLAAQAIVDYWRLTKLSPDQIKNDFSEEQWLAQLPLSKDDQEAILSAPPLPSPPAEAPPPLPGKSIAAPKGAPTP